MPGTPPVELIKYLVEVRLVVWVEYEPDPIVPDKGEFGNSLIALSTPASASQSACAESLALSATLRSPIVLAEKAVPSITITTTIM
jgi:hypothetical protein